MRPDLHRSQAKALEIYKCAYERLLLGGQILDVPRRANQSPFLTCKGHKNVSMLARLAFESLVK